MVKTIRYHCYWCRKRVEEGELIREGGLGFCSAHCASETKKNGGRKCRKRQDAKKTK